MFFFIKVIGVTTTLDLSLPICKMEIIIAPTHRIFMRIKLYKFMYIHPQNSVWPRVTSQ